MIDPPEFESPVDLGSRYFERNHPLRWTSLAIATAALFLLATNAATLEAWVAEQRPGPLQQQAAGLTADWRAATDKLGLGRPRAALNAGWKEMQAARYESRRPEKQDQR